jgi:hypothetical protein
MNSDSTETSRESSEKGINRIFTFDLVRGSAIIGVLFIHRVLYDYFFQTYVGGDIPSEIGLMYIFISMAGIFYIVSGAVYGFMIHSRLSTGKITERQVVLGGLVTGLMLVFYSYFYRIFLMRFIDDTMPFALYNGTGFIPYFILHGTLPDPGFVIMQVIAMETLSMIGLTVIFVSVILGGYYSLKGLDDSKVIYYLLACLGIAILIISPFLRMLIGEAAITAFYGGDYLFAFFTMPIASGLMPMFPHLAYGCFGAVIGLAIARDENSRNILIALSVIAVSLLVVGLLNYGTYQGLPGLEPFTWSATIEIMARKLLQIGIFFFLFVLGFGLVDFRAQHVSERWVQRTQPIILFGKLALTVYMLEGIMAVTLQRIINLIWPTWNATMVNVLVFGLLNTIVWFVILRVWQRYEFKGSLEWGLVTVVRKLSGKQSSRFRD